MDDLSTANLLMQQDPTPRDYLSSFSPDLASKSKLFVKLACACCILVSIIVLIGWYINPIWMKESAPYLSMRQGSAIELILSGISLWLLQYPHRSWQRWSGRFLGFIVVLVALISIGELINTRKVSSLAYESTDVHKDFFSVITSTPLLATLNFISIGVCLIYLHTVSSGMFTLIQILTLLSSTSSIIIIYALAFDVSLTFISWYDFTHSVIGCFLVGIFSLGIFFSRPKEGITALLTNNSLGGYIARRLIIFPTLVPFFVWMIMDLLKLAGLWIAPLVYASTVFVNMLALSIIMMIYSYYLWKADLQRKKALEEQISLTTKLEAANHDLTDFAHVISHDLKAPLRGITSLANWINTDYGDKLGEEGKNQINLLIDRAAKMNALISGILSYSQAGRRSEDISSVNMNEVIKEVIELIGNEKNIDFQVEEITCPINCPPLQMRQVLQNLLNNAVKYMDKKEGIIKINCKDEGEKWEFSVEDNGMGIEEKDFETIFQAFHILNPNKDIDSTGIGLSIVKKIVEQWEGKVWVDSKIGQGSIFHFTVPKNFENLRG